MDVLRLAGDALWVLSLSIMASATRAAWKRIPPATPTPLHFARDGRPMLRLKRATALLAYPVTAFVLGIALVIGNRRTTGFGEDALILFGVRATAAALFAVAHLRWLSAALRALDEEAALRP
jgi:hypothetical protein